MDLGKRCGKCHNNLPLTFFGKSKVTKSGYRSTCKNCRKLEKQNPEVKKRFYAKHKNTAKYKVNYDKRNQSHEGKEYKQQWYRERHPITPKPNNRKRLHSIWRNALYSHMSKQGIRPSKYNLGYTPSELKKHLENWWLEGMSWENYGTAWHIDHIIPLKQWPLNAKIEEVNALWNLQPLWAEDNLRKSAKFEFDYVRNTFFIDIDATIIYQEETLTKMIENTNPSPLPLVVEKINRWFNLGCCIIITTARPEISRQHTIEQLKKIGVYYHQLIMDVGNGPRIVINNRKRNGHVTAGAFNVNFNEGWSTLPL